MREIVTETDRVRNKALDVPRQRRFISRSPPIPDLAEVRVTKFPIHNGYATWLKLSGVLRQHCWRTNSGVMR